MWQNITINTFKNTVRNMNVVFHLLVLKDLYSIICTCNNPNNSYANSNTFKRYIYF